MATKKKAAKKAAKKAVPKAPAQRVLGNDEYVITKEQFNELKDIVTDFNSVISSQIRNVLDSDNDRMRIGFDLGLIDKELDARVEKAVAILDAVEPEDNDDDDEDLYLGWDDEDDDN